MQSIRLKNPALWLPALLVVGLMLWAAPAARALEVYALLEADCTAHSGLIVGADAGEVRLLGMEGGLVRVPRQAVRRILVYHLLDNPFARLDLAGGLEGLARAVYLDDDTQPTYHGWPVRYQEDTIHFFDLEGKQHIEDYDRVTRIRLARDLPAHKAIPGARQVRLGSGPLSAECSLEPPGDGPLVTPTRIIGEQIKISRFLAGYQTGFEKLEKFRERSVYYARPMLFDQSTLFGLNISGFEGVQPRELPSLFPFYFQWGTGQPYTSQGLIAVGSIPVEVLPNAEPLFAFRSEIKSSFFRASFFANPLGMSIGQDFIISNRFMYAEYFALLPPDATRVISHFNHVTLTGLDWGAWSFSAGNYYPLIGIYGGGLFREILSTQATTLYRVQYMTEHTTFRALYAQPRLASNQPGEDNIRLVLSSEMQTPSGLSGNSEWLLANMRSFALDSRFYRLGMEHGFSDEFLVGLEQIVFQGSYREQFNWYRYDLGFDHYTTTLHAVQRFGDYVALRGRLSWFDRIDHSNSTLQRVDGRFRNLSLMVAVEFIL